MWIARLHSLLPHAAGVLDLLDFLIFERIGLAHLEPVAKVSMAVGSSMIGCGLGLMALIFYCCGPNGAHGDGDCDKCSEHHGHSHGKTKTKTKKRD